MENYNHLLDVTEDIKYDDLPKEVLPEIKLIEHLVRDFKVFTSLKDCVLSGQIAGEVGRVDRNKIKYSALDSAVSNAIEESVVTKKTSMLIACAKVA